MDGRLVASVEKAGRLSPGHFPLNVGRNPERIDMRTPARFREARVYSRALTEAEVAASDSRRQDGLVLWLDLADASRSRPGGGGVLLRLRRRLRPDARRPPTRTSARTASSPRTVRRTPVMGEIKQQQQYVDVTPVDLAKGAGRASATATTSRTSSEIATGRYQVRADDRVLARGRPGRPRRAPPRDEGR